MSTSRIRKALHLEKSDLVQAAGKNVNDVAIMGSSFGKVIVELSTLVFVI